MKYGAFLPHLGPLARGEEFDALNAPFAERSPLGDETVAAM